jgi:hypothetical protein
VTTANGANLRQSRKELAAMTKAPAKTRKAPAKKPAGKPAGLPATAKLKWSFPEGYDKRGETGQSAPFGGGELAIAPYGEKWTATYTRSGKQTVLAEGAFGKCYAACIGYAKGVAA